ncbi:MAG: hypothetical protein AAF196_07945 [Planctomycetota bacterium]
MRRPVRIASTLLLAAFVLLGTGCFQLRAVVRILRDGSGTQSVRMAFGRQVERELQKAAVATSAGLREVFDPLLAFDEEAVRRDFEERGLELTSHETEQGYSRRSAEIGARFDALTTLRRSPLLGEDCEWFVLPGRTEGGLRIVCYPRGHVAWKVGREKARKLLQEPPDYRQQFFELRKPSLEGLDLELRLELPGAVRYSTGNVQRTDEQGVVVFRVTAESVRTPSDLLELLAPRIEVEFDGTGCTMPLGEVDPGLEPDPDTTDG